jgi:type I restriction enzyme S subunit
MADATTQNLPDGWSIVRFGDVVRNVKVKVDPETSGLERYVAGGNMETDDLHISSWGTVGDGYLGPAFHRKFVKGQVLYGSRRTYLRKVAVAEFDGICANTTFVLESKGEALLPDLLPFIMQTEAFTQHSIKQSKGSTNPYVNWKDLAWYEFALPPLDEQRRIADILWAADEGIQRFNGCLVQADNLRRSSLTKLILQGIDHTEFRKTRIGTIPAKWEVAKIDEVGDVQLGRQRSPKYQTGRYSHPYLRVANVFDDYLDLSDVLEMDFDEQDFEQRSCLAQCRDGGG